MWETSCASNRAFAEESLGSACALEFVHGYMRRALGHSCCLGEPRTGPHLHACGSAFFCLPQATCRVCRSGFSPHTADSTALGKYYDDAWPLPFWALIELTSFELSVNPTGEGWEPFSPLFCVLWGTALVPSLRRVWISTS